MRPKRWADRLIWAGVFLVASGTFAVAGVTGISPDATLIMGAALPELSLHFEANQGQTDEQVSFLTRGRGYTLFLARTEAVFVLQAAGGSDTVRMTLVGANPAPTITGRERLPSKTHYYRGRELNDWQIDVPSYAEVVYEDVYPGVDLVYYSRAGNLEYDFVLAPKADPQIVRMAFDGARDLSLNPDGNLVVATASGEMVFHAPALYQEIEGSRAPIPGRFAIAGENVVTFEVDDYDDGRVLIIDPELTYSTYLGGSLEDGVSGVAVDAEGMIYIAGWTESPDFPTNGPAPGDLPPPKAYAAPFITKLDPSRDPASQLVYTTFLPIDQVGNGGHISGIEVDATGHAVVVGTTRHSDFPVTAPPGGTPFQSELAGLGDCYVTRLAPDGTLVYSTYLGGGVPSTGSDLCRSVALDEDGLVYVTGVIGSSDFPTTPDAIQSSTTSYSAFVSVIDPAGNGLNDLVYSTLLGGSSNDEGRGIAVMTDAAGDVRVFVSGETSSGDFPRTSHGCESPYGGSNDAFVAVIDLPAAGSACLAFSTLMGGTDSEWTGPSLAVDELGDVYVAGFTRSVACDFPTTTGAFQEQPPGCDGWDPYVFKLHPPSTCATGSECLNPGDDLVYSTMLAGRDSDFITSIAVDAQGNAVVAGGTHSRDFPTTTDALDGQLGGDKDVFLTVVNASGSGLVFSTYLGGRKTDGDRGIALALDEAGQMYVASTTYSTDFPVTPDAFQDSCKSCSPAKIMDAFVSRVSPSPSGCGSAAECDLDLLCCSGTCRAAACWYDSDCEDSDICTSDSCRGIPGNCSATCANVFDATNAGLLT